MILMFTDPPIHKIDQPAVHSKVAKHQLAVPQAVNSTKAKQLDPYQEPKLIWNLRHYKLLVHCLHCSHCSHRLGICKQIYTTQFSGEFYTLKTRKSRLFSPAINSENASLSVIWPSFDKNGTKCVNSLIVMMKIYI